MSDFDINDLWASYDWIEELLEQAAKNKKVMMVGGVAIVVGTVVSGVWIWRLKRRLKKLKKG